MQEPSNKFKALDDEPDQDEFTPWTAEQAQAWRAAHPIPSLWAYWRAQVVVAVVVVLLAVLLRPLFGWPEGVLPSAVYGVLAVLLPGALAVSGVLRAFRRQMQASRKVGDAGLGFATVLLWEGCKVLATVGLLALAPVVLGGRMNWPALLLAFIVTLKAYWWAWLRSGVRAR